MLSRGISQFAIIACDSLGFRKCGKDIDG